jgi:NAD(P)-dependent dehydrogenase (short-subunit alcohol dehydrogenase family)
VDILINNAGILRDKSLMKMEESDWDIIQKVHLYGTYFCTQAAFPIMREQGYGRIVSTASAAGLYGNFGQTNYGAAKLGIAGLMNVVKQEGAKYNIMANTIVPIAGTRLTATVMPPAVLDALKPEFVAPVVAWLCSDLCTVSGQMMTAGAGYFSRAAIMEGPGVFIDNSQPITVEMIAEKIDQIRDLTGAEEFDSAMAQTQRALSQIKFE